MIFGADVLGAGLLAARFISRSRALTHETMFERMPDTSPPKWVFLNIKAIRENTDRILELLGAVPVAEAGEEPSTDVAS
jgi:hypothetical protein